MASGISRSIMFLLHGCSVVLMLIVMCVIFFFFKQMTAYEMRISDWSSDVCSSDLKLAVLVHRVAERRGAEPHRVERDGLDADAEARHRRARRHRADRKSVV